MTVVVALTVPVTACVAVMAALLERLGDSVAWCVRVGERVGPTLLDAVMVAVSDVKDSIIT